MKCTVDRAGVPTVRLRRGRRRGGDRRRRRVDLEPRCSTTGAGVVVLVLARCVDRVRPVTAHACRRAVAGREVGEARRQRRRVDRAASLVDADAARVVGRRDRNADGARVPAVRAVRRARRQRDRRRRAGRVDDAADAEREQLVVAASLSRLRVPGAPVDRAVHDRRACVHRAPSRVRTRGLARSRRRARTSPPRLRHRGHVVDAVRTVAGPRSHTLTVPAGSGRVSVCGSAVCQRILPVAGSSAAHEPPVSSCLVSDAVLDQLIGDVVLVGHRA